MFDVMFDLDSSFIVVWLQLYRRPSVASSDSEWDRVTSLVGLSSNGVDIGCPSSTRNTENYSQLVTVLFISHPESWRRLEDENVIGKHA